ncbi:MAG TPA: filamentous hemagglutinin N-terminal domain-containing protein, partial [Deltaproteobacteria bacterium]|nr:filamentous hemagglutinin N-terminal domain-containing protein [Deltaproteobacteria bacterium]
MSSSASSTDRTGRSGRFDWRDRTIVRILIAILGMMTPMDAWAGKEFKDANGTTFDSSVVQLDNSRAGQTTFTIDSNRTTIGWQDLQQPKGNTLEFDFADPDSVVLNDIGAQHPSNLNGTVISNGTVAFANPFGVFIGSDAIIDVGSLVAVGAHVSTADFMEANPMLVPLSGTIRNDGLIRANGSVGLFGRDVVNNGEIEAEGGHVLALAGQTVHVTDWDAITADFLAPKNFFGFLKDGAIENDGSIHASDAALFGGRITNQGEIVVEDGTLLMLAADAVWVTEFDNPVLFKVPYTTPGAGTMASDDAGAGESVRYAIENRGRIDAGLGHVRLAAADPLGFAIRQGRGGAKRPASIRASRIELDGGDEGRVHLSGVVDASAGASGEVGGTIDVTGSILVLDDAKLDVSGGAGGGTIRVGGDREGRGELQRARAVLVDADSEIRADALEEGDGGTIILFSEDLTSVDGILSARGGQQGGDGGFVETSGLRRFAINRTPDLTAPEGRGGSWLIDPFNITIKNTLLDDVTPTPTCPAEGVACLNKAITAILAPTFDSTGFDGILRTVDPATNVPNANFVSADLIASALATGTDVTLSTQAFGLERGTEDGDIDVLDPISIDSATTLEGTTTRLTLLAARNINVEQDIVVVPTAGRTNLALGVELRANDASQTESDRNWDR